VDAKWTGGKWRAMASNIHFHERGRGESGYEVEPPPGDVGVWPSPHPGVFYPPPHQFGWPPPPHWLPAYPLPVTGQDAQRTVVRNWAAWPAHRAPVPEPRDWSPSSSSQSSRSPSPRSQRQPQTPPKARPPLRPAAPPELPPPGCWDAVVRPTRAPHRAKAGLSSGPVPGPEERRVAVKREATFDCRQPQESEGSSLHGTGQCKPCAWFWTASGCTRGPNCHHCHMCGEDELKSRKRAKRSLMADSSQQQQHQQPQQQQQVKEEVSLEEEDSIQWNQLLLNAGIEVTQEEPFQEEEEPFHEELLLQEEEQRQDEPFQDEVSQQGQFQDQLFEDEVQHEVLQEFQQEVLQDEQLFDEEALEEDEQLQDEQHQEEHLQEEEPVQHQMSEEVMAPDCPPPKPRLQPKAKHAARAPAWRPWRAPRPSSIDDLISSGCAGAASPATPPSMRQQQQQQQQQQHHRPRPSSVPLRQEPQEPEQPPNEQQGLNRLTKKQRKWAKFQERGGR
ncbi:unnamed protein product, partial [Polarella glacialis]